MRRLAPLNPPKDLDPRLYELLKGLGVGITQAQAGFSRIARGESPDGGGAPIFDESKFVLLAGRDNGQLVYGSTRIVGTTGITRLGLFAHHGSGAANLLLDDANAVFEAAALTIRGPSHTDEPWLMGFNTSGSPVQNWVGVSMTGSFTIAGASAVTNAFAVTHSNMPTTNVTAFVQKRAGQTGNLFEWRSGGSPMSYIRASDGAFVGPVGGTTGFFDFLRIGDSTTPTHRLEIVAGTATIAPILLTSGTLLTTPVSGAIEFLTNTLYFTSNAGPTRQIVLLKSNATAFSIFSIPFAQAGGVLTGSANFTFNNGSNVFTTIGTIQATGASAVLTSQGTLNALGVVNLGNQTKDTVSKVQSDYTDTSTGTVNVAGIGGLLRAANASSSNANFLGFDGGVRIQGSALTQTGVGLGAIGLRGLVIINTNVTIPSVTALNGLVYTEGSGPTITSAYAVASRWSLTSGTVTNGYGLYAQNPDTSGGGAITNNYMLYLESPTAGGTSNWAIYSAGGVSSLAGKLRLGDNTAPTHRLELVAGTTTVAPLLLTSGTSLTTAVAGAFEFTTDDFFLTITTGAARKGIVLDDGARLTSGKYPKATTNGRLIDGPTPLTGTKVYFVADTSGGAVTRKLTFTDGILTSET
jgi:hypothetical protein